MERLTEKFVCNLPDEVLKKLGIADIPKEEYGIKGTNGELCRETCEKYECDSCPIQKAIEKLAKYEDLEEQGLLLRLLCKVGDTLYLPYSRPRYVKEVIVTDFMFDGCDLHILTDFITLGNRDIGKTIFLTKEEAEQALKQIGE